MKKWKWNINPWVKISSLLGILVFAIVGSGIAYEYDTPVNYSFLSKSKDSTKVVPPVQRKPESSSPVIIKGPEVLPQHKWVDSVFNSLTPEQKIGQLFMVSAYSNQGAAETNRIKNLIQQYHLGGLIFFQGSPVRQANLTNQYQAISKVPLLIGIDGEWGLGMRLDSTISFPRQMTLGAITDNKLIYKMGEEIGRQCQRLGIHVNFAPVADVNSNPLNPVIGSRSFGESPENVAQKAIAYMRGLQHQRVIAAGKHFPGHGNTSTDSHYALPVVTRTRTELQKTELYPFKRLIQDSLIAVLSGHLHVPVLDSLPNTPASLSSEILQDLLRKELGFKGLVFTDAMNMKGVLKAGKAAEVNLKALIAGNDVLLSAEAIGESIQYIIQAVQSGKLSQEAIDEKVKRILRAKYFAGLHSYQPIETGNLIADLNTRAAKELNYALLDAAVSVVTNTTETLPIRDVTNAIATVSFNENKVASFHKIASKYAPLQRFKFTGSKNATVELRELSQHVGNFKTVIVTIHNVTYSFQKNYNVPPSAIQFITDMKAKGKQVIVCVFGGPYSLSLIPNTDALLCGFTDTAEAQSAAAQIIFGAKGADALFPVTAGPYRLNSQKKTANLGRLQFGSPESVGVNGEILERIGIYANEGIQQGAFPGCQVLIAHKNKVIYDRSFGALTNNKSEPVTEETIYDLASITKVAATLQAVMLLYDKKQIDLNQKASHYLPELRGTDKQNITIIDLLIHRSGMVSFYPFLWESTYDTNRELSPTYYSKTSDSTYSLQVAPNLYANTAVKDSVWKWIIQSQPHKKGAIGGKPRYVYSDLGLVMLQKIVERISKVPLDTFVAQQFYYPLGISGLTYNPLTRFPAQQIAPTEDDKRYRGELLRGTVHDQMAALVGGVSGHAGLFGNMYDLATLFQMNLNKGMYGGKRYITSETIQLFARLADQHAGRGLGWDKPRTIDNNSYLSEIASPSSFGHTGFTGNVVWIDPAKDLIYIFLSNRVYPNANNNKINTLKTRRKIHNVAYEALLRTDTL